MYIFLDESGDLGFSKKSQQYFVIAILITKDKKPIENCIKRVRQRKLPKKYKRIPELKFRNSNRIVRKSVLKCLSKRDVEISYILLNKRRIYRRLQDKKNIVYNYITSFLLQKVLSEESDKIEFVVDRLYTKRNREEFNSYINYKIQTELRRTIKISIEHKNSEEERCLQAVDFVAGAIYRKYVFDDESYYSIIRDKIQEEIRYLP
ncbi:MAG TPA: hypothetical protein C5S37_03805 [Methanophagales archaeon]|nr:hypothetical protein [Methanophagales archaeon]